MNAPTGAQAAADLAATRCAPVVGSHMPGCPHVDWTRPVRVLTRLESVGNPFGPSGSLVVHQDSPVRVVPAPAYAPMLVGRWRG